MASPSLFHGKIEVSIDVGKRQARRSVRDLTFEVRDSPSGHRPLA